MGHLVSIVHTPAGIDPRPPDHYARVPLETVTLEAGRGIQGDRKGAGRERQLNIMAAQTLVRRKLLLRWAGEQMELLGQQSIHGGVVLGSLDCTQTAKPVRRRAQAVAAVIEQGVLGGEPLRTLLDAEHHLSLHDQRRGLHREHADTRGDARQAKPIATDQTRLFTSVLQHEGPDPVPSCDRQARTSASCTRSTRIRFEPYPITSPACGC